MDSNDTADRRFHEALLAALQQNWEHARHEEKTRVQYCNLYWLAIAVALVLVLQHEGGFFVGLRVYWLLFVFLGIVGIPTFFAVTKVNLEFGNHIRAIQWIAEKLSLNKKAVVTKPADTMFTGYMALPLRLRFRVAKSFKFVMYVATFVTWWAAVTGLLLRTVPNYVPLGWAAGAGSLIGVIVCVGIHFLVKPVEQASAEILKNREPEGIEIKY